MGKDTKGQSRLYHVRILRPYLEYVKENYPEIDVDSVLAYARISNSEVNDDGFWYSQEQSDRFHEILDKVTGNKNIARDVGRCVATSPSLGTMRQYVFSMLEPSMAYMLLGKIGAKLTKGTTINIRKLSSNSVEAVYTLNPGVDEKPYQCENRYGMMEAVAIPFTGEFAHVEHKECIHKGCNHCRYIISWKPSISLEIRRIRSHLVLVGLILGLFIAYYLSPFHLSLYVLLFLTGFLGLNVFADVKEIKRLRDQVKNQGWAAEQLIAESDRRYRDAELIQEIGRAISTVLDISQLLKTIMTTLEKHFDYDRGMVLLANSDKTSLIYKAGYGYPPEVEKYFQINALHLDNPESKGPFVLAFKKQMPYLVNNIEEILEDLSERSKILLQMAGAHSFICIPIVYENESLGVLSLDNKRSSGPPKQSDLNLLMGIAPQIAISIMNARSFERLQSSEDKYRDLVESANSIIMRLDTQGRITFINKFAQGFYGYREIEMIGREAFGFIIPKVDSQGSDMKAVFRDFLENPGRYKNLTNLNLLKGGEKAWISWSNKAIYDKEGKLVEILCVGNDITERNKAEEVRKRLEVQLQRSQKMEAIGMLAGGVAHDLNNILSGVVSLPEILLMEIQEESPLRKTIEAIKRSGEKAAAIVQDLLTLARRGVSVSNPVNLNTILNDYFKSPEYTKLKEYHPLIYVDLKLESGLLNIMGSAIHLSKTIMNLVTNAMEAMPKGGQITVRTENRYLEAPVQGYDLIEKGEYAVLSIEDTGIGISPEDIKRIFEPFYSKKVMGRSGTGLGMAVIWSTVKDHRGFIDVESKVGVGTRFDLYFPATREEVVNEEPSKSLDIFRGSEKILVIDDMPDQQEIARKILEKLGYEVKTVSSGEEALDYLRENVADLVLLDMIMDPGMDGLEAYKNILKINPAQRAIIVSGYSETDRVRDALCLGAGAYVRKPYLLHDIARAVRIELDKKI